MSRQPYLNIIPRPSGAKYDIGTRAIGMRPDLEKIVGHCLMAWPHIEAEMALVLGQLLGAQREAALAVFQSLRRSSAQRDAIAEASKASLSERDHELISAVLNGHKSIEAERNALAHGHFGTSTALPDALMWMPTSDFVMFSTKFKLSGQLIWSEAERDRMLTRVWVYRLPDLEAIYADILALAEIWYETVKYLQIPSGEIREAAYLQLCDQPRIAQELVKLRQKNSS
jgi:hypothetical protein